MNKKNKNAYVHKTQVNSFHCCRSRFNSHFIFFRFVGVFILMPFGSFQLSVQFQKMNHICEYVYRYILCVKSSCSRLSKQLMLTLLCLHEYQWIYMYMYRIWMLRTSPPMHVCYTRRYCLLLLIMMTFLRRIFKNKSPISLSIISSLSFIFAHLCIWLLIWVCLFL